MYLLGAHILKLEINFESEKNIHYLDNEKDAVKLLLVKVKIKQKIKIVIINENKDISQSQWNAKKKYQDRS